MIGRPQAHDTGLKQCPSKGHPGFATRGWNALNLHFTYVADAFIVFALE